MATVLKGGLPPSKYSRENRPSYDWSNWTNGKAWLIRQGVDFETTLASMRACISMYALRHQYVVTVRKQDDKTLAFQFSKPRKSR